MVKSIEELIDLDVVKCSILADDINLQDFIPKAFLDKVEYRRFKLDELDKAKEESNTIIILATCKKLKEVLDVKTNYIFIPLDANFLEIVDIKRPQKIFLNESIYNKNEILILKIYVSLECKSLKYYNLKDSLDYILNKDLVYLKVLKSASYNHFYLLIMLIKMLYLASKNIVLSYPIKPVDESIKKLAIATDIDYVDLLKQINVNNIAYDVYNFKRQFDQNSYNEINENINFAIKEYKDNLLDFGYSENVAINEIYNYLKSAALFAPKDSDFFILNFLNMV